MAARKVKFHPDGYYHVLNRGANRQKLFLCPANFTYLIAKIRQFASKGIGIIAYCLMPNHFHFLLWQKQEYKIAQFMQSIFNIPTTWIGSIRETAIWLPEVLLPNISRQDPDTNDSFWIINLRNSFKKS